MSCELVLPYPRLDRRRPPAEPFEYRSQSLRLIQEVRHRLDGAHCCRHHEAGNSRLRSRDNGLGYVPIPIHAPTTTRNTIQLNTNQHNLRCRTNGPTPGSMFGPNAIPNRGQENSTRIRGDMATNPRVRRPANSSRRWSSANGLRYRVANHFLPWAATPRFQRCRYIPRSRRRPTVKPPGHNEHRHTLHWDRRRSLVEPEPSEQNHPYRSTGSQPMRFVPHRSQSRNWPSEPPRPPMWPPLQDPPKPRPTNRRCGGPRP